MIERTGDNGLDAIAQRCGCYISWFGPIGDVFVGEKFLFSFVHVSLWGLGATFNAALDDADSFQSFLRHQLHREKKKAEARIARDCQLLNRIRPSFSRCPGCGYFEGETEICDASQDGRHHFIEVDADGYAVEGRDNAGR